MAGIIRTTGEGDEARLCCPVCGFDYIHPTAVQCNPAGALGGALAVQADGVHLDKTAPPEDRGVRIVLQFACENGHAFQYMFHFRKGWTLLKGDAGEAVDDMSTIWRT